MSPRSGARAGFLRRGVGPSAGYIAGRSADAHVDLPQARPRPARRLDRGAFYLTRRRRISARPAVLIRVDGCCRPGRKSRARWAAAAGFSVLGIGCVVGAHVIVEGRARSTCRPRAPMPAFILAPVQLARRAASAAARAGAVDVRREHPMGARPSRCKAAWSNSTGGRGAEPRRRRPMTARTDSHRRRYARKNVKRLASTRAEVCAQPSARDSGA